MTETPIAPSRSLTLTAMFRAIALLALLVAAATAQQASRPILDDRGTTVVLSNGKLEATIAKSSANLLSLKAFGSEFVRQGSRGMAYYSMDGGTNYRTPSNCKYTIHSQSDETIDISLRQTWTNQRQAVDVEIHYVIRAGDSGIYTYALLDHPADYPATRIGEWRMVWKMPDDLLNTICVDRLRYRKMPSAADITKSEPTGIKEITKMVSGVRKGLFECKYDYNANYYDTPFWGHADSEIGLGAWMVFGAHEWFNDGPTKQDLTSAENIIHVHFGMNHYNGSGTSLAANQTWKKIYGPFLLYVNKVSGGTDASIRDVAKRQKAEAAAWPYAWLRDQAEYPSTAARGRVRGSFTIHDPAKPKVSGANAWIGLAQPAPGGNWQFDSMHYQYWTRVADDGSFTLPNVRPGSYTLSAFNSGSVGEFAKADITIAAGKETNVGLLTWKIPRDKGRLVWEIGVPDRSAAEFRHGDDYFQGYLWTRFGDEWSNPLEYTIGKSDPKKDWNYAHSGYPSGKSGLEPWKWRIHFHLDHKPETEATLTLAIASADGARLDIFANDEHHSVGNVTPSVQGGNALLRESIHAKYCVELMRIPAASLKKGENTITLVQSRIHGPGLHVMYDYLSLEVPDALPTARR